jgi:hypothetical protein
VSEGEMVEGEGKYENVHVRIRKFYGQRFFKCSLLILFTVSIT